MYISSRDREGSATGLINQQNSLRCSDEEREHAYIFNDLCLYEASFYVLPIDGIGMGRSCSTENSGRGECECECG